MTVIDISQTIEPRSDQQNADDFLSGPRTITITRVAKGDGEQPVSIFFEGDNGKPYKPGKSMRRVMVHLWGKDASQYVGRSMTLYRDNEVVFGGVQVGGIRISHMSHIDKKATMALTTTRAKRKPFTVQVLERSQPIAVKRESTKTTDETERETISLSEEATNRAKNDPDNLATWWNSDMTKQRRAELYKSDPEQAARLKEIVEGVIADANQ